MKVKLCTRCPYSPIDVASHYDAGATVHLCAGCDDVPVLVTHHYPRDVRRSPKHIRMLFEAYERAEAAR